MSESEEGQKQDPAPIKHSDAERVSGEQAQDKEDTGADSSAEDEAASESGS